MMTRGPALLLACLIAAAVVAPAIAPYPPDQLDLAHRREAPSAAHWFGTDDLGRDVFARVLFGARVSLAVGLLSAAVAGASGIAIGGVAGYAGGALDAVLMRGTDAMLAVPRLPLLMIAASVLQPSVALLVVMIGMAGWMETARVVRAEFLTLRARGFDAFSAGPGTTGRDVTRRTMLARPQPQTGRPGGQMQRCARPCIDVLTARSSREWNEMTASRPPRRRRDTAPVTNAGMPSISRLTAMRSA